MKILDLSNITGAVSMPLKKGTIQFIQDAYFEALKSILIGLIGSSYNPTTVYVIYGLINTGTDPSYIISAGAVFYDGEIYLVDAISFTVTGTDTAIFTLDVSQYTTNADPVQFTDLSSHNVHNIRKFAIVAGGTGTGIADFTQAIYLSPLVPKINLTATGASNQVILTGAYPNINIFVPPTACLAAGRITIGNPGGGGTTVSPIFVDVGTSDYFIAGSVISKGTVEDDTTVIWTVIDGSKTSTQFSVHFREINNFTQDIDFEWMIFSKPA
jgi:hypothetical protein